MELKGLTREEVQKRIRSGQINGNYNIKSRSILEIIFKNTFTLFNFINLFLAGMLIMVGSYKNMLFLFVMFWNSLIGIVQEIRSKKIVDKLSILAAPNAKVLREEETIIKSSEVVMDDLIILETGNQVMVDSTIISGNCEVDESLLTGESETIYKNEGDGLLSGSFIVSGKIYAKVTAVGRDNYAYKITEAAKYIKKVNSEILKSIRFIIKLVLIPLIPLSILLFVNQIGRLSFDKSVVATVAAVIGMIPSGLVLLTSMVLAVSVIRLAKKNTLIQELYCIETLSRVNVLCLDKTGTITEGRMRVEDIIPIAKLDKDEISKELAIYTDNISDNNATYMAVYDYSRPYKYDLSNDFVINKIPFSSDRKWSLISYKNKGSYVLGAYDYIFSKEDLVLKEKIDNYMNEGLRVLVFCHSKKNSSESDIFSDLNVLGIILISDIIRADSIETFNYFKNQGVNIKVISGDNEKTVSHVAKAARIDGYNNYISLNGLSKSEVINAADKYTIFGRVSPEQKYILIKALREKNNIVAMTGDGVNDVLALKEADCSIAMQSGSDAARNVSQIVLMDSDFKSMPDIVLEGRRTVNNIERSASLYLTKTIYSSLLAFIFLFLPIAFPFIPLQLTLIGALLIGIPSFILAMQPNTNRIKGKFIKNVLKMSIPGGFLVVTMVVIAEVYSIIRGLPFGQASTLSYYALSFAGFLQLIKVSKPLNKLRRSMIITLFSIYLIMVLFFKDIFGLQKLNPFEYLLIFALIIFSIMLYRIYGEIIGKILGNPSNIYTIYTFLHNKKILILVEDEVLESDYYEITNNFLNHKYLKAEVVGFINKPINGGDIKVSSINETVNEHIIAAAARFYQRKHKKHIGIIRVEYKDKIYEIKDRNKTRMLKKLKITF